MRLLTLAFYFSSLVPVALLPTAAVAADDGAKQKVEKVERCEGPKGKITYSNEGCPSGTHKARSLDGSPALVVAEEKDKGGSGAKGSGQIARTDKPLAMSEAELREADAQFRRQQRAKCDELAHQISYASQDLAGSSAARASAELSMRRLQADYAAQCPKHSRR